MILLQLIIAWLFFGLTTFHMGRELIEIAIENAMILHPIESLRPETVRKFLRIFFVVWWVPVARMLIAKNKSK